MGQTLQEIAQHLSKSKVTMKTVTHEQIKIQPKQIKETKPIPKVQLIYAFNGTGKTLLSRELKDLVSLRSSKSDSKQSWLAQKSIVYYSAFTEDLFYWDNDLSGDAIPKLKIQPNAFTDWILRERGDVDIVKNFQRFTNDKITPLFQEADVVKDGKKTGLKTYPEVFFSIATGSVRKDNVKISKGEESNFIWSIFYTLLQEIVSILDEPDKTKRSSNDFDQLEYVFIDDPVSSLDDNHLIDLAVSLAGLIKSSSYSNGNGLKFVVTTHNPLFYNILFNEFNNDLEELQADGSPKKIYKRDHSKKYRLTKEADGTFLLKDSNDHPFSYHLFLLSELRDAINNKKIEKYHFNFLRNILEKTATFLGYKHWEDLLEKIDDNPQPFIRRLNLFSHSAHAGDEVADLEDQDKEKLKILVERLTNICQFN